MYTANLSSFGVFASRIFSYHLPNGSGSSLNRVMSWVFPTTVLPTPRMMLFLADVTVVLYVCVFFLPEYVLFFLSASPERRTGMWVPSTRIVRAFFPGMNSFSSSAVLHFDISTEILRGVGSISASILLQN